VSFGAATTALERPKTCSAATSAITAIPRKTIVSWMPMWSARMPMGSAARPNMLQLSIEIDWTRPW
jgi:hypothetical protein